MGVLASGLEFFFNNPFRVLGVPVNATAKDIEKSLSRAKALASIGREIEFDSDIPLAVEPERTPESLQMARGKIEQLGDRLEHSLWWFWSGSTADEMAFDALRGGDEGKAVRIWARVADGKPVSDSNYSAVRNLGLYYLGASVATGSIRKRKLQKSFELLGAFIGSTEHLDDYLHMVARSGRMPVESRELAESFGRVVARFLAVALSAKAISIKNLGVYFQKFPEAIWDDIAEKFTGPLTRQIEDVISQTEKDLKKTPETGLELAERVIELTEDSLEKLEDLPSGAGYKLEIIRGQVADAILQSTSLYFNHVIEGTDYKDPGPACLELSQRALLICPSGNVARKLETDIEYLEEWIAGAPRRKLQPEFKAIKDALDLLPPQEESRSLYSDEIANRFFRTCRPILEKIKRALGPSDEQYQNWSNTVAQYTIGFCQGYLLEAGEPSQVQSTLTAVGKLYMSSEAREWYSQLTAAIKSRYGQPARRQESAVSRPQYSSSAPVEPSSAPADSEGGCGALFGVVFWIVVAYFIFQSCTS